MTDIVERLRLCDDQMVALDHLNRPYGLAKSLEHEAADEIERLRRIPAHYGAPLDDPDAAIRWITGIMDALCTQREAERDRLREALQDMLADREAWQIGRDTRDRARAALKETEHD